MTIQEALRQGALKRGLTRPQVEELLGAPEAKGGLSRKYTIPMVYRYAYSRGNIQLFFGPEAESGLLFASEYDWAGNRTRELPLPVLEEKRDSDV